METAAAAGPFPVGERQTAGTAAGPGCDEERIRFLMSDERKVQEVLAQ